MEICIKFPYAACFKTKCPVRSRRTSRCSFSLENQHLKTSQISHKILQYEGIQGPIVVNIMQDGKEIVSQVFYIEQDKNTPVWQYAWAYFDTDLKQGEVNLILSKYEKKNCTGYTRYVDCFLITDDTNLIPNHLDYAIKTYMRVTVGYGYEKPVQIHAFVPFTGHFHISKAGIGTGTAPNDLKYLLNSGETSPWCNITPMLYPTLYVGGRPIINAR